MDVELPSHGDSYSLKNFNFFFSPQFEWRFLHDDKIALEITQVKVDVR